MESLDKREKEVLKYTCVESLKKSGAVGSKTLAERIHFKYSPATIRNTFSSLEKKGYLCKFHFSSGRVPTDLGWRYFVDEVILKDIFFKSNNLLKLESRETSKLTWQEIVEYLAKVSGTLTLFFTFLDKDLEFFYQAGISKLFSSKNLEGEPKEVARDIDRFVESFSDWIFKDNKIERWPLVLIGQECELTRSGNLSFIIDNAEVDDRELYLLLVGPKIMAYRKNLLLLEEAIATLTDFSKIHEKKPAQR